MTKINKVDKKNSRCNYFNSHISTEDVDKKNMPLGFSKNNSS